MISLSGVLQGLGPVRKSGYKIIPPSDLSTPVKDLKVRNLSQLKALSGPTPEFYAIDIGSYSLKIATYTKKLGKIKIIKMEQVPYRERFDYTETEEKRFELLREALERFFSRKPKDAANRLSLTLPSSITFIQLTRLPVVSGKLLRQAVEFEIKDKIPIPLAHLVWDFLPLPKLNDNSRNVILAAVRKEAVEGIFNLGQKMNLQIDQIGVGPAILYENLVNKIKANETLLVLDLGAHTTDVIVITHKGFWSRTITFGGYKLTQWVSDAMGTSLEEAEHRIMAEGLNAPKLREILETKLEDLLVELKRTLTIYRQEVGEHAFSGLLLLGGMAQLKGLNDYFTQALSLPLAKIVMQDVMIESKEEEVFFQAACLAKNEGRVSINLLPTAEKLVRKLSLIKNVFLFYAGLALILLLFAVGTLYVEKARLKNQDLALEQRLMQFEEDKGKIRRIQDRLTPWIDFFTDVKMRAEEKAVFIKLLAELDKEFHRSVWLDKIYYDHEKNQMVLEGRMREKLVGLDRLRETLDRSDLLGKVNVTAGHVDADDTRRFTCSMEIQSS